MSERREPGKSLVTDYSRSNIDPDRAAKLNKAELEYVNGIWDDEDQVWVWPSYPQLAAKHDLPLRVINEQAAKHNWVSRRELRKTQMLQFQNEQTRKRWLEEEREIAGILMNNIGRSVMVVARLQDEHTRIIKGALKEEADRRAAGEEDPVVRVGIRPSEVEGLMRASETAMKTLERLAQRISGLPTVLPEPAPPQLIQTVEQEKEQEDAADQPQAPEETLLEVYKIMRDIEEARARGPRVILMEEDDEDE
jgi:hypothetical protein